MGKPLTPAQVKRKLALAINNERVKINYWQKETNPQVVEMRNRAIGRLDAFEAILEAMDGSGPILLNLYAEVPAEAAQLKLPHCQTRT